MASTTSKPAADRKFRRPQPPAAKSTPSKKKACIYPSEITKFLVDTQKQEGEARKQYVAPNTQVIPVVNVRTGSQHFMVPETPEPICYKEPLEHMLDLKKLYRTIFVLCVIGQTALTLAQLFFWVELVYNWPVDFLQDLINIKSSFFAAIVRELTFCLALHPVANGGVGMLAMFCDKQKCLRAYFLRSSLFCLFTIAVILFSINFISIAPSIDIIPTLEEGIDLYDLQDEKARHYHQAWDVLQKELKCCGIKEYNDWVSKRPNEVTKVPKSCCRAFRLDVEQNRTKRGSHYDDDLEYCQMFPTYVNTWDTGCLFLFFDFVTEICTGFVTLQLLDVVLVVSSSICAMVYDTSWTDSDYDYPFAQYFIDCFFCTHCIRLKKPITEAEIQEIRQDHHWRRKSEAAIQIQKEASGEFHVYHQHQHGHEHHHRRQDPDPQLQLQP